MATPTYAAAIDLDGNGDFTDAGEDVTALVSTNPPAMIGSELFRSERGRDQSRLLAPPMAGEGACTLDNMSATFPPGSGLRAGVQVRLTATFDDGGGPVTYDLHRGIIDQPRYLPTANFDRLIALRMIGTLSRLAGQKVSTALYTDITTDVAIGHLLDAVGWPALERDLDMGKTTLLYWWLDNEDAMTALVTLLNTEGPGAAVFEGADGAIVFRNRHSRVTDASSTTPQATFRDSGVEPLIDMPFSYDPGLKDVVNVCTIEVNGRTTQAAQEIWALGSTVTLAPGEVRSYVARGGSVRDTTTGQYIGPFTGAITPTTGGGDYVVASGSLSSVTLDRTSGASVTMTLTAGASGASITGLRLRAQPVTVDSTTVVSNTIDASASIASHGTLSYKLAVRPEIAVNVAQDFANAVVGYYQDGRTTASVTLMANGDDARMAAALSLDIGHRVRVSEASTPVDAEMYVDRIEHRVLSPSIHFTTFGLEEADAGAYFVIDESELDGSDLLGF